MSPPHPLHSSVSECVVINEAFSVADVCIVVMTALAAYAPRQFMVEAV